MSERVMYLRNRSGQPVGCVMIKRTPSEIQYNMSVLNPEDDFNRVLARQIAKGRLDSHPRKIDNKQLNLSMHEITRAVMSDIERNIMAPSRARKAAKNWLRTPEPASKITPIHEGCCHNERHMLPVVSNIMES